MFSSYSPPTVGVMVTRSSPRPTRPRYALSAAGVAIALLAVACGETGEPPTAVPAPSTTGPAVTTTTEAAAPPTTTTAPVVDAADAAGSIDAVDPTDDITPSSSEAAPVDVGAPTTAPPPSVPATTSTSPSSPGDETAAGALAALDALDELLAGMTGQVDGLGDDLAADAAAQAAG